MLRLCFVLTRWEQQRFEMGYAARSSILISDACTLGFFVLLLLIVVSLAPSRFLSPILRFPITVFFASDGVYELEVDCEAKLVRATSSFRLRAPSTIIKDVWNRRVKWASHPLVEFLE